VETVASVSVSTQIRSYHAGNVEVPDFSYYRYEIFFHWLKKM
jgi:hypothetical protein